MQEFSFILGDKPGALLEVMSLLAEEKVNVEAIAALTILDEAVVSMVTDNPAKTRKALKGLGVDYEEREALSMCLPNQSGRLAPVLARRAAAFSASPTPCGRGAAWPSSGPPSRRG